MFSKRNLSLLLGACLWPWAAAVPSGQAASSASSSTLDVNFFYDTLKDDGSWFNTTEYGDVWQPHIAYKNDDWRPYTDGYWTYTDGGWMFVSYENFGWAVYHYGRWTQLKDLGWAWVPGTEWAPAWVTWRESKPAGDGAPPDAAASVAATTTDADKDAPREAAAGGGNVSQNYVGWAPLPPEPEPVVYGSSFAYGPTVDIDYGIDPYDYNFVDVRYFGAPFIGGVLFDRGRGYDCCERSVNVTNFYYNDRGGYRGFYNGGPRYERFQGVTERPIPRFNLQRQQGRLAREAVRTGQYNQIKGNTLNVAAPRFSQANVRNGRVNFKNRGALPVTPVNRDRPANAANNDARQRARDTFQKQGQAFRAQNPDSQSARRAARQAAQGGQGGNPAIATTPRAQREERQARQAAQQAAGARRPDGNPNAGGNPPIAAPAAQPQTKAGRRAARQEARRQAASAAPQAQARTNRNGGGGARQQAREARRSARQSAGAGRQQRQAAPRIDRQPRGGGGGGRAMRGGGGGGGRAVRAGGGGGGRPQGGGGRGGGGGGGGGKKKK